MFLYIICTASVPARFGKGQGPKEIGHNLKRERPKFGHNLVRTRHKIGHSLECKRPKFGHNPACERNEVWAQICGRLMGTNLQAFYKHFYIGCPKTQKQQLHFVKIKIYIYIFLNLIFFFRFGQGACKSGRAQDSTGRAQRPQK